MADGFLSTLDEILAPQRERAKARREQQEKLSDPSRILSNLILQNVLKVASAPQGEAETLETRAAQGEFGKRPNLNRLMEAIRGRKRSESFLEILSRFGVTPSAQGVSFGRNVLGESPVVLVTPEGGLKTVGTVPGTGKAIVRNEPQEATNLLSQLLFGTSLPTQQTTPTRVENFETLPTKGVEEGSTARDDSGKIVAEFRGGKWIRK